MAPFGEACIKGAVSCTNVVAPCETPEGPGTFTVQRLQAPHAERERNSLSDLRIRNTAAPRTSKNVSRVCIKSCPLINYSNSRPSRLMKIGEISIYWQFSGKLLSGIGLQTAVVETCVRNGSWGFRKWRLLVARMSEKAR